MLQLRNLSWRRSNQGTRLKEGMSQECIHQLSPNPLHKIFSFRTSGVNLALQLSNTYDTKTEEILGKP